MANRTYQQGLATLSFPNNGPAIRFRLNPDAVDWNFQVKTAVIDTLGGRVIQILGADLSDLTVRGRFGNRQVKDAFWQDAEDFTTAMRQMITYQHRDAIGQGKMHEPAVFNFPSQGWRFQVYIKGITDGQGQFAIQHTAGKFSYDYVLTLSIYNDLSNTSRIIGKSNGTITQSKSAAVQGYMDRIFDGIGWKASNYNGPDATRTILGQSTTNKGSGSNNKSRVKHVQQQLDRTGGAS